jgi:Flp pilus assembly protein TadD
LADAMRGLLYDGDRVRVDEVVAASIAQRGTIEQAMRAYDQGRDLLRHNHRTGALRAFTKAVLISPEEAVLYQGLGTALAAKGATREAIVAHQTALAIDPDLPGAHFQLAVTLHSAGRLDDSIAQLDRIVKDDPSHGQAHGRLAIAHYYQGDGVAAWRHVHRADELGYRVPPQFRDLLNDRYPE